MEQRSERWKSDVVFKTTWCVLLRTNRFALSTTDVWNIHDLKSPLPALKSS